MAISRRGKIGGEGVELFDYPSNTHEFGDYYSGGSNTYSLTLVAFFQFSIQISYLFLVFRLVAINLFSSQFHSSFELCIAHQNVALKDISATELLLFYTMNAGPDGLSTVNSVVSQHSPRPAHSAGYNKDDMKANSDLNPSLYKEGGAKTRDQASSGDNIQSPSLRGNHQLPTQRRKRVLRACDECRREKIGCDGKRPCAHCTVYGYGKNVLVHPAALAFFVSSQS